MIRKINDSKRYCTNKLNILGIKKFIDPIESYMNYKCFIMSKNPHPIVKTNTFISAHAANKKYSRGVDILLNNIKHGYNHSYILKSLTYNIKFGKPDTCHKAFNITHFHVAPYNAKNRSDYLLIGVFSNGIFYAVNIYNHKTINWKLLPKEVYDILYTEFQDTKFENIWTFPGCSNPSCEAEDAYKYAEKDIIAPLELTNKSIISSNKFFTSYYNNAYITLKNIKYPITDSEFEIACDVLSR
jgi:hypothetical protein